MHTRKRKKMRIKIYGFSFFTNESISDDCIICPKFKVSFILELRIGDEEKVFSDVYFILTVIYRNF